MDDPASPAASVEQLLVDVVKFARSSEKLIAAGASLLPAASALADVRDYDDDLTPEIDSAFAAVQEALSAIRRAGEFVSTRYDVAIEKLNASFKDGPSTEGDPS